MSIPTAVPFYLVIEGSFDPYVAERDVEACTWAGTVKDIADCQFENLTSVIEVGTGRNVADRMVREAAELRNIEGREYSHVMFKLVELHIGTRVAHAMVR